MGVRGDRRQKLSKDSRKRTKTVFPQQGTTNEGNTNAYQQSPQTTGGGTESQGYCCSAPACGLQHIDSSEVAQPNHMGRRPPNNDAVNQAVRNRDRNQCVNCTAHSEERTLDVHHIVPRGRGGSHRISNQAVLCRKCHDAAHGDGYAPTVQVMSTGGMSTEVFEIFRRFWRDVLPEVGCRFGIPIQPIYDENTHCWRVARADMEALSFLANSETKSQNIVAISSTQSPR